ncbi:hypothetical protein CICLE_v100136422mg, partial [Citrus x clementina]
ERCMGRAPFCMKKPDTKLMTCGIYGTVSKKCQSLLAL